MRLSGITSTPRRRVLASLVVIIVLTGGVVWWQTRGDGLRWSDVGVGDCVDGLDRPELSLLHNPDDGIAHTRLDCADPHADYVVAVRPAQPQIGAVELACPDPGKDRSAFARYALASTSFRSRLAIRHTSYGYAPICLAPNLQVGGCYDSGNDRGGAVARATTCDGLFSWQVTRRVDGVADIGKCSPATGLVLHVPSVTYCEIVYPDRSNPLLAYAGHVHPPPAG